MGMVARVQLNHTQPQWGRGRAARNGPQQHRAELANGKVE